MRVDDSLNETILNDNDIESQKQPYTRTDNKSIPDQHEGYVCHVDFNNMNYSHSQTLSSNALVAYQLSKGLKYASILSFFMNLALVLFNRYYVLFVLCSLWGYFSALQYNPGVVLSYFAYAIINMIVRLSINTYDSVSHFDDGDNVYGVFNMIWGILLVGISIYGLRLIWRVYAKLIICTEEEKLQLRNIKTLNLKALCW